MSSFLSSSPDSSSKSSQLYRRRRYEKFFRALCFLFSFVGLVVLTVLLYNIIRDGWQWLSPHFLTNFPSRRPSQAGLYSALWGSFWVMLLTTLIAVPMGIATALYLEEYIRRHRWSSLIQLNIATLAGMPSIIYGLLGLAIFVRTFGFGKSLISGALTLSLLILPVIVISSQGAIRAVPKAIRDGAYALGARRWQVTLGQVLPAALPGIMTGVILALSRAIGETAPLILIGALSYIAFVPRSPFDSFTVLPVQIFNWAGRPSDDFHGLAAAGIIVLLILLFVLNFIAIMIREKMQRYK